MGGTTGANSLATSRDGLIPPILHQTWKSRDLPPDLARLHAGWRRRHPQWDIRFYDDDEARALVARARPKALALYDALPLPVMRADLFRCIAVHTEGGVYADIDMECLRPLDRFLDADRLTLCIEASLTPRHAQELGYKSLRQLANCIFAAPAGDAVLGQFITRILADGPALLRAGRAQVEDLTGPRRLTRFLEGLDRPRVRVLRQITWMAPREYPALLLPAIHARHLCRGSWKAPERVSLAARWRRRNRLPNPFPMGLEQPLPAGARA